MGQLVLTRALSYQFKHYNFRRGVPIEVRDPDDYLFLQSQGLQDPSQNLNVIHPKVSKMAPAGTEIPVIRQGGLGDVLMVSIGLRDFANRHPKHKVTMATHPTYVPLFRDCDFLHRVLPLNELRGDFPWTIDLRGYTEREHRERIDRISCFSEYLNGVPPSHYDFPLYPTPQEIVRGREITGMDRHLRPTVAFAWRAIEMNRTWPDFYRDRFCEIASDLGWKVALIGAEPGLSPHMARCGVIDLCCRLSMEDLIAVTAAVNVVVAPDTGIAHLAEACKTKSVVYYTTVPPEARSPHYRYARTLFMPPECGPCYHSPTCGRPHGTKCAMNITPQMVWNEVEFVHQNNPPWEYRAPIRPASEVQVEFKVAAR